MAKELKIILTQGLSGSGKSTWAKEFIQKNPNYINICKDDLRAMLNDSKHSKSNEEFVLFSRDALINLALLEGKNIIISDTNLHPKHKQAISDIVKVFEVNNKEVKVEIKIQNFMDIPLDVCIERDLKRFHSVGEKVIKRQYNDYLKWNNLDQTGRALIQNINLPKAITCDLDGTLSLFKDVYDPKTNTYTDLRSPYDASTCYDDVVNEKLAELLHSYKDKGYKIIFVSGREDKYEIPTREFLLKNMGWNDSDYILHMRETGDKREDGIIKSLIFQDFILPQYQVHIHFDDRNRVVEAIRDLGITVWQVADGDF